MNIQIAFDWFSLDYYVAIGYRECLGGIQVGVRVKVRVKLLFIPRQVIVTSKGA